MPIQFKLKNLDQEAKLIGRRTTIVCGVIFIFFLLITWRIFYLQIALHDHYTTLSQSNRVKIVPIPPTRGLIFGKDGVLLADNRPSFSLEIIPEKIENLDKTILQLSKIIEIDEVSIERFRQRLKKIRRFESVPLRFNLSDEEIARVSVNLHDFEGIDVVARLNRNYPLSSNTSHIIGYVGMIDENELKNIDTTNYSATGVIGKIGVEKTYEELLHGKVGYQQVEVNAEGRIIRVLDRTLPIPGKDIYLTLDTTLQNLAVQALEGNRGAVVAVDPIDGSILAMVSSPSYDPNLFVNGIDSQSYNRLIESVDKPLLNRALKGTYPPGSTIKPMLGMAALHYGIRGSVDETWCPGWYILKGTDIKKGDWKKEGHGNTDLRKAIAESCDVYFYSLANDLGIDKIGDALSQFGFGTKTQIDIGDESSGLLPSKEWKRKIYNEAWYPGETINVGIGQGALLVTPMQLAVATAAVANRGKVLKPHLFSEAHDPLSDVIHLKNTTEELKIVIESDAHWDIIVSSMIDVVHSAHGTARGSGQGAEYQFAGKSGTAQVFSQDSEEEYIVEEIKEELRDHALFIAFGPIESSSIVVAIIIENGGGGSTAAAPIARLLFDYYINKKLSIEG